MVSTGWLVAGCATEGVSQYDQCSTTVLKDGAGGCRPVVHRLAAQCQIHQTCSQTLEKCL